MKRYSRLVLPVLAWLFAISVLFVTLLTTPVDHDEVYYLAASGVVDALETPGATPMRLLLFRPVLSLPLAPAGLIMTGRFYTITVTIACAVFVLFILRRMHIRESVCTVAATAVVLILAKIPMVFIRPEYFACLFLVAGTWSLVAPPRGWSFKFAIFIAFTLFTLAATTSLRQPFVPVGAFLAALAYPTGLLRNQVAIAAVCGVVAGLIPSVVYLLISQESLLSLWYWNYTFSQRSKWLNIMNWRSFASPAMLFTTAIASIAVMVVYRNKYEDDTPRKMLAIIWLFTTVSAVLDPHKFNYSLSFWIIVTVMGITILPYRRFYTQNRLYQVILGLLILIMGIQLVNPLAKRLSKKWEERNTFSHGYQLLRSQLGLINWIYDTSKENPVMCVAPYHPIRGKNLWIMWNGWIYCHIRDNDFISELNPDLENILRSGKATIIAWNPSPIESGQANILEYAQSRGFVTPSGKADIAQYLSDRYILVEWKGIVPVGHGKQFLVKKDTPVDHRVQVLDGTLLR